ncbi:MAG: RNA-guided endonuclease TnpB family protein [Candidatus Thorarchaeota archaeon]
MGRSSGVMVTVKVPVKWDAMTDRQKSRLSRITSRDTRVIKAYLGVIEYHEKDLLFGKRKKRLDAGAIDKLTLRTDDRRTVLHDFKARFPTISVNELQECRETAIAMWKVYLALGGEKPLRAKSYSSRKLPRHAFKRMFELEYKPEQEIKHWLILRDSLDSSRLEEKKHARLAIPLSPSSYHLNRLKSGETKSVQIVKDRRRKWWVLFKVKQTPETIDSSGKPPAVIGIDLGIKKAACSVVLTREGVRQIRYWTQKDKVKLIEKYDQHVASLQSKKEEFAKAGVNADDILKKLRSISKKRENISFDYDRKLVRSLADHILELSEEYDVYVAIGRLKGIRNRARRGDGKGRAFRGMINRWAFARITNSLKHKLSMEGFNPSRVYAISEAWTSIKCHKCGNKGLRPRQNYFLCHTCGYRDNADRNAATNIGRRLIKLIPLLRDEKGLGMWLFSHEKDSPKTQRSTRSKGKSSRSKRSPTSSEGEIVADCEIQTSLEMFDDSTDPAMTKTMETSSAVVSSGTHDNTQRTEAQLGERNSIPMMTDKPHAHPAGEVLLVAGDNSREEG